MGDYKKITGRFGADREQKLRSIKRFSIAEVFLYRSSLWQHSLRVYFITRELSKIAGESIPGYDADKAEILALVHDDAEMITGDVQLGHKEAMSDAELNEVHNNEAKAIGFLASDDDAPTTLSLGRKHYFYGSLLYHALQKDCVEAQVVSYADKLDAYCESLHELFAGNLLALRPAMSYGPRLKEFGKKYPLLKPLLSRTDSIFANPGALLDSMRFHRRNYLHLGKPHTIESIHKDTEFTFYNLWRKIVLDNLGEEGLWWLITQVETM